MKYSPENMPLSVQTNSVEYRKGKVTANVTIACPEDVSQDDVKEALVTQNPNIRHEDVTLRGEVSREELRERAERLSGGGGKVYGFSKWGANWQPTGPGMNLADPGSVSAN